MTANSLYHTRLTLAFTVAVSAMFLPGPRCWLLSAVAVLAWADILVNDWMHAGCYLPLCQALKKHRERVYTGVGAACIAAMFPLSALSLSLGSAFLFIQASAAIGVAIADTHLRYVRPRKLQ